MSERASAPRLIERALVLYDAEPALESHAREAALGGFGGGLAWMRRYLRATDGARATGHRLGLVKYGVCTAFAVAVGCALSITLTRAMEHAVATALSCLLAVLAFYALESRWVFVFPAAAHGDPHPFRTSWRLTGEQGGTLAAMRVVLPIASFMLFAPLARQGFVRAWTTGCLAVLLWYRDTRGFAS
jgi:putative flippase GtrA